MKKLCSLLGLLLVATAVAAPQDKKPTTTRTDKETKPVNTTVVSRLQLQLDATESALVELLAGGAEGDERVQGLKVSYRMVIRRLYEAALAAKNDELRAQIALRADTLVEGATGFDSLVAKVPEWVRLAGQAAATPEQQKIKASLTAAIASTAAFEKATAQVNQEIADAAGLRKYLAEMIGPLEAAVKMDAGVDVLPTAWPEVARSVVGAADLPAFDATVIRVQQAPILPALRSEMQAILPTLKSEMDAPASRQAATREYRKLLDTLALAERIGSSTALNADARADLNERLRKALILFKDPRTRASASTRLAGVANVARTLGAIEASTLTVSQKALIGEQVRLAILALSAPATAKTAGETLAVYEEFVTLYASFNKGADQSTLPTLAAEWKKLRTAGDLQISGLLDKLQTAPEEAKPRETVQRLGAVIRNFDALATLPGLVKRAEALRPKLGTSVERRLTLLARTIAETPDASSAAAEDIAAIGRAIAAVEASRAALSEGNAAVQKIAGERQRTFVAKLTDNENKLITALGQPNPVLATLVSAVEADTRLVRAAANAVALEDGSILDRLNRWGGLEIDRVGRRLVVEEITRSIAGAFFTSTGGIPPEEPLVALPTAADAAANLAAADGKLAALLPEKAIGWSRTFTAVTHWPEGSSLLAAAAAPASLASYHLNEAACNATHDGAETAIQSGVKKAIERLAAMPVN